MVAKVKTFTFLGINVVNISVEVKLISGVVAFNIVGLPDKAVNESRERIRASMGSIGLSFPAKRLTVNLSPASLNKEGSYLDLPIALGLLVEMGIIAQNNLDKYVVMGELSLDGTINAVNGVLPAAISALENDLGIICPKYCAREALWASETIDIVAADNLLTLVNVLNGRCKIDRPILNRTIKNTNYLDLGDIYGQRQGKRALEIAAAGGHNLLMIGPPGSGKSMLAQRIMGILPDLTSREILEINIINSIAGKLINGELISDRPFLDPHHSCSMPAMVGGGSRPKPGQISLAHSGVLFLDELPEFSKQVLDSLRQPLETGKISIARAYQDITYPARFQLIAAMNPCRCGHFLDTVKQCKKVPNCARDYQDKISGPILDRFDLFVDMPKVNIFHEKHTNTVAKNENSSNYRARVEKARNMQEIRYSDVKNKLNAYATNEEINKYMKLDCASEKLLEVANKMYNFSVRTYNKLIKVSRTIADLAGRENIEENHIAEALMFKQTEFLSNR
jgi:magnesium chelatase family protein